jgi:pilus assembly protein CpaF
MSTKALKEKIRQIIINDYGGFLSPEGMNEAEVKAAINEIVNNIVKREHTEISQEDKESLVQNVIDEILGYGPIQGVMLDPTITEVMINGPKKIYVERRAKMELSSLTFESEQQLMYLVYKMLSYTRRRVDESNPYTEIALKDGARVNIIIPPLAPEGPIITIRKFLKEIRVAEDLINLDTINQRMADFLIACIKAKVNIIFIGATGTGKTTTLNVLSSYIPNNERIITIEDTAELKLSQDHVVRLECRPASIEGKGEVGIRELFKNSLRMRPDRIIIGEIRGPEALDMMQAICSGHAGSLAILHANSSRDAISRLEMMAMLSGLPLSLELIHRQISETINLLVHQEQLLDGSRKVMQVTQISGLKAGHIVLEDIFYYDIQGFGEGGKVLGTWKATGTLPIFYHMFKKAGVNLPEELFKKD